MRQDIYISVIVLSEFDAYVYSSQFNNLIPKSYRVEPYVMCNVSRCGRAGAFSFAVNEAINHPRLPTHRTRPETLSDICPSKQEPDTFPPAPADQVYYN